VGSEEGEWLARFACTDKRLFGVRAGTFGIACRPVIRHPSQLPFRLPEYRAAPRNPLIVCLEPGACRRQIAGIGGEGGCPPLCQEH